MREKIKAEIKKDIDAVKELLNAMTSENLYDKDLQKNINKLWNHITAIEVMIYDE